LRQHVFADRHARADEERARDLPAELLHARIGLRGERENALRIVERERARSGERDAPLRAIEKARVEMLFELLDLEGDGRLRHEERLGGLGERQMLRYGVKDLEAAQTHSTYGYAPMPPPSRRQSMMW